MGAAVGEPDGRRRSLWSGGAPLDDRSLTLERKAPFVGDAPPSKLVAGELRPVDRLFGAALTFRHLFGPAGTQAKPGSMSLNDEGACIE
jgi:hypothetical protein